MTQGKLLWILMPRVRFYAQVQVLEIQSNIKCMYTLKFPVSLLATSTKKQLVIYIIVTLTKNKLELTLK